MKLGYYFKKFVSPLLQNLYNLKSLPLISLQKSGICWVESFKTPKPAEKPVLVRIAYPVAAPMKSMVKTQILAESLSRRELPNFPKQSTLIWRMDPHGY